MSSKDSSVYIEHMLDCIRQINEYLGVDVDTVWSVVEQELPKLEEVLNKIQLVLQGRPDPV